MDVPGNFPALVDSETWWRAQAVLSGGASTITPYQRNRPAFPLRGTVRCGKCGRPLTASWSTGRGGKYGYYHCPVPAGCKATRVRREVLEKDFFQLLGELRPAPAYFDLFRAVVLDTRKKSQKEVVARRAALIDEIDIEAVLAFAEHLALRADRLWMAASLDERQRLQKVLFPDGITIRENRLIRTQPSLLLFNSWDETANGGSRWCALEDSNL